MAKSTPLNHKDMTKDMEEFNLRDDDDLEEMDPSSGSVHSGSGARSGSRQTPPNSLAIMPDVGKIDTIDDSRVLVRGFDSTPPDAPVDWTGTSWSGGMTQGCTAVFRSQSVDTVTTATGGSRTATTSVPFGSPNGTTPKSPSSKLDTIKTWTISTYKCSKQSLLEKLGKSTRTVDTELESQIEALRDTQRKYSNILRLARALTSHFYHVVQTQNALGECFSDLAHKSPELQEEFQYNADTQRNLCKNGDQLLAALNFFVSSVNTLCNKTMEDTIAAVKQYETARVEFDAYRCDLEYYGSTPQADPLKKQEVEAQYNKQKLEFEKLRSDVQIKLKFLDENRVKVMHKQLLLFHNAVSAYFSGNQASLDATMKQFSIKVKTPNSSTPSWIEK